MGSLYYDLVGILRNAGCNVQVPSVCNGWERRARSSGGFSSPPIATFWHHTASNTTPINDLTYMIKNNPDAPVGNLLLDRDGIFYPIAGGASNCAGKGNAMTFSRGTGAKDSGNTWGFQIECANAGTGQGWPQVQVDALIRGSNALSAAVGNRPSDITSHALGAGDGYTDRKIDPATAAAVAGPWKPRSTNSSGTWSLADMRNECNARAGSAPSPGPDPGPGPGPTPPTPDDEDDDMLFDGFWTRDNDTAVWAIFKNGHKQWMTNQGDLEATKNLWAMRGAPPEALGVRVQSDPCMFTAFGLVEGPMPADGKPRDEWGNPT